MKKNCTQQSISGRHVDIPSNGDESSGALTNTQAQTAQAFFNSNVFTRIISEGICVGAGVPVCQLCL